MTCRACEAVAVGLGAALGSGARFLVSLALAGAAGPALPLATLGVNVAGSFLIGLLAALTAPDGRLPVGERMQLFLMAGICGGFTTFSVFSLEMLILIADNPGLGSALFLLSLPAWMAAVWLGYGAGRGLAPPVTRP